MFQLSTKNKYLLLAYAMPNTLLSLGLLYLINKLLVNRALEFDAMIFLSFVGMIILAYGFNIVFQRRVIGLSNDLIYENELRILQSLQKARLSNLEHLGKERIYGILEDLRSMVFIPYVLTNAVNALFLLLVGILYFFYLSFTAAIAFIGLVVLFVGYYWLRSQRIIEKSEQSRKLNDHYFRLLRDFIDGFKSHQLNRYLQSNMLENFLYPNRSQARDLEIEVSRASLSVNLLGQYGLFLMIGLVIFVFPYLQLIDPNLLVPFVIAILFIAAPINTLAGLQTFYIRVKVANDRIGQFLAELKKESFVTAQIRERSQPFSQIQFNQVHFQYPQSNWALQNLDLTIRQGETIFVIGGNGSGKSTFIHLLTNLYAPQLGRIELDGQAISANDQAYRELFSAVFTDPHLFSEHYHDYPLKDNPDYQQLLKTMKLDQVISDDRNESALRSFSKGQSKRMAMIYALLEQRPILVLDEWAADQDPYFRRYFYEELLPAWKAMGKTIIAVTHDDAYFKQADRILKFDYGRLVKNIRVKEEWLEDQSIW